ncbi:MAG TPA: hypothetical protein VN372_03680 [Methanospirillum sp.]|nr:hypothetical protein [Methanospirillum sp.]
MSEIDSPSSPLIPYCRVFALELQQTDIVGKSKDTKQTEIITPSGARMSHLYCCGVVTEINRGERGSGLIRLADPTGVLLVSFRSRSPAYMNIIETLTPPEFVSITARVEPEPSPGESRFRLALESIHISDRESRDRWILRTADQTLSRLERLSLLLDGTVGTEEERRAVSRYKTSKRQLQVLAGVVEKALLQVRDQSVSEEQSPDSIENPAELILELMREHSGPKGISVQDLSGFSKAAGLAEPLFMDTLRALIAEDEIYQPSSGYVKIL